MIGPDESRFPLVQYCTAPPCAKTPRDTSEHRSGAPCASGEGHRSPPAPALLPRDQLQNENEPVKNAGCRHVCPPISLWRIGGRDTDDVGLELSPPCHTGTRTSYTASPSHSGRTVGLLTCELCLSTQETGRVSPVPRLSHPLRLVVREVLGQGMLTSRTRFLPIRPRRIPLPPRTSEYPVMLALIVHHRFPAIPLILSFSASIA